MEDIKLFLFFDKLLSVERSRTITHTTVNLFHSDAIKDPRRFKMAKDFYLELANVLDLQYGNVLLATLTKAQLQAVIDNDWPFFTSKTELVKGCLLHSDCDSVLDILQKLGRC